MIAGHLAAALALLHCSLPLAVGGLAAVGISYWREQRRRRPCGLLRDAAGDWWLCLAGGWRQPAKPAAGPVPGVISVTMAGHSETLFDDAFGAGEQRRLRALLRHRGGAGA